MGKVMEKVSERQGMLLEDFSFGDKVMIANLSLLKKSKRKESDVFTVTSVESANGVQKAAICDRTRMGYLMADNHYCKIDNLGNKPTQPDIVFTGKVSADKLSFFVEAERIEHHCYAVQCETTDGRHLYIRDEHAVENILQGRTRKEAIKKGKEYLSLLAKEQADMVVRQKPAEVQSGHRIIRPVHGNSHLDK